EKLTDLAIKIYGLRLVESARQRTDPDSEMFYRKLNECNNSISLINETEKKNSLADKIGKEPYETSSFYVHSKISKTGFQGSKFSV
ncbi:1202_t:CDS:1, partial [Dentiscutata heterogama]